MKTRAKTAAANASSVIRQPHSGRGPARLYGLVVALALLPPGVPAQPLSAFDEVGRFYAQSFAPQDYGASEQNWAFVQDERGFLYVGNSDGVLEYDGASWRLIPLSNRSAARSLAIDAEGRIFVGAQAELGYLAPDSLGRTRYVSLVEQIPEQDRAFADVWRTHALSDGVYFSTYERLFRWRDGRIEVWRPETSFWYGFAVRDTFYIQARSGELLYLDRDTLRPAPGGAAFTGMFVSELVPHGADAYLVLTRKHGLFRCLDSGASEPSGTSQPACVPFATGLTDLLSELEPYYASVLRGEILAIGTMRGGLVLLDRAGHLLRVLNETSGLHHDAVWASYVDRQGGLWLGFNDGLARLEITAALSYFDKATGLQGIVSSVARHRGRLYASTTFGLYVLEPAAGEPARFVAVPDATGECWSLLSTPQGLLAGCLHGVFNLDRRRLIWPYRKRHVFSLYRSGRDPTRLYLGLEDGVARLELRAGAWRDAGRLDGIPATVRSFAEDTRGRLWMGTQTDGVLRLEADADFSAAAIRRFGVVDGLPVGWVEVRAVAGQVRVLSREGDGLFRLGSESEDGSARFVPDTTFRPPRSASLDELTEDGRGRVWITAGDASSVAHPAADGGFGFAPTALRRIPSLKAYTMAAEPSGAVWVGGPRGLVRLAPEHSLAPATDYSVRIRRITASDGSSLYEGEHPQSDAVPAWSYESNALRFAFAAPRYAAPERTEYRTRLDGFDDDWSAWSTETDKDYTNLWGGRYVFRVEARDVDGVVSREDAITFRILPPWYRTWWAYGFYVLALGAAALVYVRSHREELRHERAAKDREREVNARLREVDKLKDEFLANTSHELRTPLFGIIGLAESLIDGIAGELPETAKANLTMIAGSGRRLGQLVNDILDYSRLTHGNLRLRRGSVDLRSLTETVLTLQKPLTADKDLELRNAVPADLPAADADEARLEQILHNLVGNSVKFTSQGHVEISASLQGEQLTVVVEDTGIGIAEGERDRIFMAFEQADSGVQRAFGGTGLGLTVTRRLVELHGGSIEVESAVGEGTRFAFTLPVSREPARPAVPSGPPVSRPLSVDEPAAAPAAEPMPPPDGRDVPEARILVVDDEPLNRLVLSQYLVSEGYEVELAASGAEALRRTASAAFDLVVLDVMMPKMSGYEVCRALREHHSLEKLPVIFLTARNQVSDLVAGLAAGGNDYLAKPVGKDELLARVRTHLQLLSVHRQLARVVGELEARNADLARFNYSVAHDLKNPLTTIMNFLGLARQDAASGHTEHLEKDFDLLDDAARKLQRQLDDLFELSRVGILTHPPEEVPFGELVREALAELAGPIAERGVEVVVAADLPVVTGDRTRLQEALRHLLSNAVSYLGAQAAPRIEVGVLEAKTVNGEPPTCYVRDNGMGIDPQYHEKVFGLFERVAPEASEGTGIGLALVKRIVEVHGGHVWMESEGSGQGSTFYFTLPRDGAVRFDSEQISPRTRPGSSETDHRRVGSRVRITGGAKLA